MTGFDELPAEQPAAPEADQPGTGSESATAWGDVVRAMDQLGSSVAAWAKAVKDDPENRERARQVQEKLEGFGKQVGEAFDAAARSDFAQHVSSAAVAAGDAAKDVARKFTDEAASSVADALRSASESIRKVAERQKADGEQAETPESPGQPDDYVP